MRAYTTAPAGKHKTAEDAYLECAAALDELPLHLEVTEVRIWRFSNDGFMDKETRGRWTWEVQFYGVVGGYDKQSATDAEYVAARRKALLAALRAVEQEEQ